MPRQPMQKIKLLLLAEYFEKHTDESHFASVEELISYLESCGVPCERKALYNDIEALVFCGYDIIKERSGKGNIYYLASRTFETAELKMLVDIIGASRFVTAKKSEELISKIETLCSVHDAAKLSREVYITGRVKATSEVIYLNVDKIHSALAEKRGVEFKYFYYDWDKEKRYRRDGDVYRAVPLALMWNNDNYYLVAHDKRADAIRHFRVDKMEKVVLSETHSEKELEICKAFDPAAYSKSVFDMYGGVRERVELSAPEKYIGNMFDRFGMDVVVRKGESGDFIISVEVELSPSFFAWLSTFEGDVKIFAPESAKHAQREHLKKILSSVGE